jgi:hypothetical protein
MDKPWASPSPRLVFDSRPTGYADRVATPILDLEQDPPAPANQSHGTLVGIVIGLAMVALPLVGSSQFPDSRWPAFNGFLALPCLYIAIAFHEAGHALFGKLMGLDLGGVSVGAFRFIKSGENWTFKLDWSAGLAGFYRPLTTTGEFDRSRYAWMVAGGPLASVFLAAGCWWAAVQYGSGTWNWIGSLCWASIFLFVASAIPYSTGSSKSDAALLKQLISEPRQARAWIAVLAVQSQDARGVRPRDWHAHLFAEALMAEPGESIYVFSQVLAFYRCLDQGSDAEALTHLENALARSTKSGKPLRHALFLEAASASAILQRRPGQARIWLGRAGEVKRPEFQDSVLGAIAMCEGRYEESIKNWQAAKAYVDQRKLDSGLVRFAKERWSAHEATCLRALR